MQQSDENQEAEELILTLPMSRRELASYLGTSPESISRKFTEFEQEGLIEQVSPKKIRVIDIDGLLMYGDEWGPDNWLSASHELNSSSSHRE